MRIKVTVSGGEVTIKQRHILKSDGDVTKAIKIAVDDYLTDGGPIDGMKIEVAEHN